MGAQSALLHLLCTPYQFHRGKWLLLPVLGYKASPQIVFIWLFNTISLQFVVIIVWSGEKFSAASTYSPIILDLPQTSSSISPIFSFLRLHFVVELQSYAA